MAGKVTRKGQVEFLIGVAAGRTVKEAVAGAGISERQGLRRVQDPGFRQQVSRLWAAMLDEAAGRLAKAAGRAVES